MRPMLASFTARLMHFFKKKAKEKKIVLVMCENTVSECSHVGIQKKDLKMQYCPEGTIG